MLPGRRTAHGAIFIAQGPAPAGTPLVAGIAVSPAGVIYASQALAPGWSPIDLFLNGEQGAWYDPSDLTTMFQDSAGTVPVTADGQPVGKILDKSGNGNHATQSTAAQRPLYKTSGGLHWLQFDGVEDSLSTTAFDLTLSATLSHFIGFDKINDTSPGWMFNNDVGNSAGISFVQRGNSFEVGLVIATNPMNETISSYPTQQKLVVCSLIDPSVVVYQEKIDIRVNTIPVEGALYGLAAPGSFGNFPLKIGTRSNDYYLGAHLNSLIILGRLAMPPRKDDTETWVNSKTGAY